MITYISFIISLLSLSISLYSLYKQNKQLKDKKEIIKKKKNNIDKYDYLYSLDFNNKLDGYIKPLLGKFSNNEIIAKVISKLNKEDIIIKSIDDKEMKEYIFNILKYYDNNFIEKDNDIKNISIEENINDKDIDLSSTLNAFYKD